ncbi:MAG: hypothetical protein RLZZ453_1234 [Chlamydiota bacterium]|jgi:hypothetical protein
MFLIYYILILLFFYINLICFLIYIEEAKR